MRGKPVPIRIDADILERLDAVAAALSERAAGAKISRAGATRVAIERGLDSLETELRLSKKKPRK